MLMYLCLWLSCLAGDVPASPTPQAQDSLPKILNIAWSRGPDLPFGFQDSEVGIVNNMLISVAGFCCGHKDVPGKPDKFPRGFKKQVIAIPLDSAQKEWKMLPDFPGEARQELFGAVVENRFYCWGGFSYTAPFCYKDGYCLSQKNDSWQWEPIPDLPWPLCSSGVAAIGSKIYIFGGGDYDENAFYSNHDRKGKIERMGAKLLVFDTKNAKAGWKELTSCPGTPRWFSAATTANGLIYVIGGATGNDNSAKEYCTVVDNWRYDPASDRWERLRDLPVASGNFPAGQIVFQNRYVILGCGYQYPNILNPDGSTRISYGKPYARFPDRPYFSDMFVYDIETNLFGTADSLPLNNNLSSMIVEKNRIHFIGGETGGVVLDGVHYPKHPDLYLIGTLSLAQPNPKP